MCPSLQPYPASIASSFDLSCLLDRFLSIVRMMGRLHACSCFTMKFEFEFCAIVITHIGALVGSPRYWPRHPRARKRNKSGTASYSEGASASTGLCVITRSYGNSHHAHMHQDLLQERVVLFGVWFVRPVATGFGGTWNLVVSHLGLLEGAIPPESCLGYRRTLYAF